MTLQDRHFTAANGLTLHYRDSGPDAQKAPLLLLHSLSDNGHVFDAVIAAGLPESFRLIIPDGRGRGKSSRPETGYSLQAHAEDLLALMDELELDRAILAGHSFGALFGLYFAATYGHRVAGLAMIDAAVTMNPLTPLFLLAMSDRLGRWYSSEEAYIGALRATPFMTSWDETMRNTFLADTLTLPDGSLIVLTQKRHIAQAAADIMLQSEQDWRKRALAYAGPALVLTASEPFMMGQRLNDPRKAIETAVLLAGGEHELVHGNHFTMMYGKGAISIAGAILHRFAGNTPSGPYCAVPESVIMDCLPA